VIPGAVDVLAARQRIQRHVDVTPLHHSAWLSTAAGTPAWLKLECVQRTGSFKFRGALNALSRLQRGTHVVTASAGNHGRAIALAAEMLGLQATVFTPRDAPRAKLDAIRRHGATLREHCASYDEAEVAARAFAQENGLPFVSPYNHPHVVAGAGTIALEVFEALPDVRSFVVPIGGAGLISGIAIAAKSIAPATRVIGVEVAASSAFSESVRQGRITTINPGRTIADGLGGNMDPETITFEIVQRYVDDLVTVTEQELAAAMRGLAAQEHAIAEGAGAAAAAAVTAGKARTAGPMAVLVTGSNIDLSLLLTVLNA
jgi:threonine dehydratase